MYKVFMFIGKKKTIKRPCFFSGVIEINLGLLQDNYHQRYSKHFGKTLIKKKQQIDNTS